jgi:uncharacterized protein YsxB (DUF464 family)
MVAIHSVPLTILELKMKKSLLLIVLLTGSALASESKIICAEASYDSQGAINAMNAKITQVAKEGFTQVSAPALVQGDSFTRVCVTVTKGN